MCTERGGSLPHTRLRRSERCVVATDTALRAVYSRVRACGVRADHASQITDHTQRQRRSQPPSREPPQRGDPGTGTADALGLAASESPRPAHLTQPSATATLYRGTPPRSRSPHTLRGRQSEDSKRTRESHLQRSGGVAEPQGPRTSAGIFGDRARTGGRMHVRSAIIRAAMCGGH